MDASPKERYQGEEKILISIDLGTTIDESLNPRLGRPFFAGAVAYTHLFPGSIPRVK